MNVNPYTQAGWSNAGHGPSQPWNYDGGHAPSIFGALPSLPVSASVPRSMHPDSATFQFSSFNTTILNCSVYGLQARFAYRVVTDPAVPSCTVLKDNENRNVAMVQWQPTATLEIRGVAPRQRLRDWLRLTPDRTRRSMEVKGVQYVWSPIDDFICLSKTQSSAPRILARIARAQHMVLLELTQEAIQLGLLEPALVATIIFICGHNID